MLWKQEKNSFVKAIMIINKHVNDNVHPSVIEKLRTEMLLLNHRVFNLTNSNILLGVDIKKCSVQQMKNYIWYLNFELEFYKKELGLSLTK